MEGKTDLTRRSVLALGARLGGGLIVAVQSSGCAAAHQAQRSPDAKPSDADPTFFPSSWLQIAPSGKITFFCDKAEMGQGVTTSLTMILAEELAVRLDQVTVEFAPADRAFINRDLGLQVTGGSSSVHSLYTPLREAGASARETLRAAAAERWQIPLSDCHAADGAVHASGKKTPLTYGALADSAGRRALSEPVLTDPAKFKLIGKDTKRIDARAKALGTATFGIDVAVKDALVAVVLRPPSLGAELKHFNADKALALPGIIRAIPISTGLALVGKSYWRLRTARELVEVEWQGGQTDLSSDGLTKQHQALVAGKDGKTVREDGDVAAVFAGQHAKVSSIYQAPYLAHATMEPQNCTAHVTEERCEIWAPTQAAGLAQQVAHEVTGLDYTQIEVHTTYLGGGFGRRLAQDYVREAVEVSQAIKGPVKVQWSREDDMKHSLYRPATYHALEGVVDGGKITAWQHAIAGQSILGVVGPQWLPAMMPAWVPDSVKSAGSSVAGSVLHWMGKDDTSTEGAKDMPYQVANVAVRYHLCSDGLPVGFWRSVGHSYTGFVVESFVDELAHAAKADPVAFRVQHLAGDAPLRPVIAAVTKAAGWDQPLPKNKVRGFAAHSCFGSHAAQVTELERLADGQWRLSRVVVALECGRVINPDQVRAQLESAVIFGLSAALYGEITVAKGEVQQNSFDDYQVVRMDICPKIETVLVPSDRGPSGVGEPGLPPTAAALGNALFMATGVRQRSLPLKMS